MGLRAMLDVDGVLADFVSAAAELHGISGHLRMPPPVWDVWRYWGMDEWEFRMGMDRRFWRGIRPYPWASRVVDLLEQGFGAQNVFLATRPQPTSGCLAGKLDWVRRNFPRMEGRLILLHRKEVLAGPGAMLVDDSEENCRRFVEAGGYSVVFPAPWNAQRGRDPLDVVREAVALWT